VAPAARTCGAADNAACIICARSPRTKTNLHVEMPVFVEKSKQTFYFVGVLLCDRCPYVCLPINILLCWKKKASTAFRTDRCTNEVGIRDRIESVWRSRRTKKFKKTFTSLWWPIALNNDLLLKKFRGFAFLNPVGFSNLAGFWRSYSNIIFKANLHTAKTTR